ncbi:MAG: serine/threonine protein kinase, partial [Myxococcaceae bacterium]
MRLARGIHLGPYEVLSTLGTGGMAEVYRARDTRLGRDIALKVVNEALASDPELVRRFEHEARLAGSLNHPNLVAVYDFGVYEGAPYFITELLKGESLRQRVARGHIPVDTALDWGAQLAQGLAAAHARGIIHRDVKPENVFVTSDGHVKLLDFGIAKLVEGSRAEGPHGLLEDTVTPTGGQTRTGAILGTPAYMSPEQVRGERIDTRTDIFSLGSVLYEMLSGRRPFPGGSLVESGHAILHDEPAALENVSPALAQLVRRCLAKEPEARIQSARDLAFALEMLRADAEPRRASPPAGLRGLARRSWWALVLVGVAAVGIAVTRLLPSPAPLSPSSERVTLRPTDQSLAARFTPDGRIVFSARSAGGNELFERNLASLSAQPLGLENWELAAVSSSNEFAVLKGPRPWMAPRILGRVPGGGGTPRVVAETVVDADWSPSGDLAIVRLTGPRSSVEYPIGKTLFEVTAPARISSVRVSPHGDRLAFIHHPGPTGSGEVMVIGPAGKTERVSRRWHRLNGVAWGPGDEAWYSAGERLPNTIQALPPRGAERSLYGALNPIFLHDVSPDGRALVGQGIVERDIVFLGEGAPNPRSLSVHERDYPARLSRDGRLALFSGWDPQTQMVTMLRKTSGAPPQTVGPGWGMDLSPDGRIALLVSLDNVLTRASPESGSRQDTRLPDFSEFGAARFAGGTDRVVAAARARSDPEFHLYSIDLRTSTATPVSDAQVDQAPLEVSPGA